MLLPLATVLGLQGAATSAIRRSRRDMPYLRPRQTATKNMRPYSLGLHLMLTRVGVCRTALPDSALAESAALALLGRALPTHLSNTTRVAAT